VRFKAGIDRLASEFEELARSDARRPLEDRDSCSAPRAAGLGVLGVRQAAAQAEGVNVSRLDNRPGRGDSSVRGQ